jgi:hypothetical protein
MADPPKGCARTTGTVVGGEPPAAANAPLDEPRRTVMTVARVGQKAPDFEAPAYHKGAFTSIKLSSLLGRWVLLCFYPGDFTFV